jgi:thioesterase domain-containing protein
LEHSVQHLLRSELVPIQPDGEKPPLLFLPSLGAETHYAQSIAIHLKKDRPVLGLHPTDPMGEVESCPHLEVTAGRYVDDLCALQPEGSFRVVGYSFSGILAYETARQLVERGRQVKMLAIIDTGLPRDCPPTVAGSFGISLAIVRNLPVWVLDNILRNEPNGFIAALNKKLQMFGKRGKRILSTGSLSGWKPEIRDYHEDDEFPPEYFRMMESNLRALREYKPKRYSGRLTLLRARTRPILHSQCADDLGWGEYVDGGVEVLSIPGHHTSIMKEPGVQVLASNLQSAADNSD